MQIYASFGGHCAIAGNRVCRIGACDRDFRYLHAQGRATRIFICIAKTENFCASSRMTIRGRIAPYFSTDGETIVFTREMPNNVREFWSVNPAHIFEKLDAAPDWYAQAKSSPYFTNVEPQEAGSAMRQIHLPSRRHRRNSSADLQIARWFVRIDSAGRSEREDDQIDGPGHGKHFVLRDLKTGTETEFSKIPGFYGAFELLHDNQDKNRFFLFDGPLRLAFFDLHLNSTDGDTVFALDFTGPRLVRLSPNWATPIPLPGQPALLTFTENRYVPIPASKKTANCSYIGVGTRS